MGNIDLQLILKFPVYLCFMFAISSADYTEHYSFLRHMHTE